jgi:hypothetical protein
MMAGAADIVVMAGAAIVVKAGAAAMVVTAGANAWGPARIWGAAAPMVVVPKNPPPARFMVDMTGAEAIRDVDLVENDDISPVILYWIAVRQSRGWVDECRGEPRAMGVHII